VTNVGIIKKRIHPPRERFGTPVHIIKSRCWWEFTAVLRLEMFNMGNVFGFDIVDPGNTNSNWT